MELQCLLIVIGTVIVFVIAAISESRWSCAKSTRYVDRYNCLCAARPTVFIGRYKNKLWLCNNCQSLWYVKDRKWVELTQHPVNDA